MQEKKQPRKVQRSNVEKTHVVIGDLLNPGDPNSLFLMEREKDGAITLWEPTEQKTAKAEQTSLTNYIP